MATHKAKKKISPYTFINIRDTSALGGVDIGNFNDGQVAQGTLVGADPASQWMNVEMIDDVAVTRPSFIAAWLCDLEPIPQPPSVTQPNIRVEITFYDDFTGLVETYLNDGEQPISSWTGPLKPTVG